MDVLASPIFRINGGIEPFSRIPLANGALLTPKLPRTIPVCPTVTAFVNQPNITRNFRPHLTDLGLTASVPEVNPNFMRTLDLLTGNIPRYTVNGNGSPRIPYGFDSHERLMGFSECLRRRIVDMGIFDGKVFVTGSAATGKSFRDGIPYDFGRPSDIDIEICSRVLFELQLQKYHDLIFVLQTTLSEKRKIYEEAKLNLARALAKERQTGIKNPCIEQLTKITQSAHAEFRNLKGLIHHLKWCVRKRRLMPNYALPPGLADIQYYYLPKFTDLERMIGIQISSPEMPFSSDVNPSSILLFP